MMSPKSVLAALALSAALSSAKEIQYKDMGPAAFMWPPDRVWSGDVDNTGPCGSVAAPNNSNRTEFPMENGAIALVAQDVSYYVQLSISYASDPKSDKDFKTLIEPQSIADMKLGHTCVHVGDVPETVKPGDVATFQIKYTANFDKPNNETFYACSDVKFVKADEFTTSIPCFNATVDVKGSEAGSGYDYHHRTSTTSSLISSSATAAPTANVANETGSSGLSSGVIAGVVVGSVLGAIFILVTAVFLYRRRAQKLRVARHREIEQGMVEKPAIA